MANWLALAPYGTECVPYIWCYLGMGYIHQQALAAVFVAGQCLLL